MHNESCRVHRISVQSVAENAFVTAVICSFFLSLFRPDLDLESDSSQLACYLSICLPECLSVLVSVAESALVTVVKCFFFLSLFFFFGPNLDLVSGSFQLACYSVCIILCVTVFVTACLTDTFQLLVNCFFSPLLDVKVVCDERGSVRLPYPTL